MQYLRNNKEATQDEAGQLKESVAGGEGGEVKGASLVAPPRSLLINTLALIVCDMRLLPQNNTEREVIGSDFFLKGIFWLLA